MSVETQIQSLTNAVAGLNAAVANVKTSTDKTAEVIPTEASKTNKLVDRAYLAANVKAGAQFKIVQQLPTSNIDEATVYIVPVQVGQTDNIYQEWIYINNKWEKIGEPISIQGGDPTYKTVRCNFNNNGQDIALLTNGELPEIPSAFVNYIIFLPSTVFDQNTSKNFYITNLAGFIAEKSKVIEMNISFVINDLYDMPSFELNVVAASYVGQDNPLKLITFTQDDFISSGPGPMASAHLTITDVYGGATLVNYPPGISEPEFISVIQSRPQVKPAFFYPE